MLENVRLKVEAFDYLQLPFVFTEGCIGRLEVQVRAHCTSSVVQLKSTSTCFLFVTGWELLEEHESMQVLSSMLCTGCQSQLLAVVC